MKSTLTSIIATTAIATLGGCASLISYLDNQEPYSPPPTAQRISRPVQNSSSNQPPEFKPQRETQWVIEDACIAPKIVFRGNDSRYSDIPKENFVLCVWEENKPVRETWNFHRGETIAAGLVFPESLYGEDYYAVLSKSGTPLKVLERRTGRITPEKNMMAFHLDASGMLDEVGSGDYIVGFAFTGRKTGRGEKFAMASMQYFRVSEK